MEERSKVEIARKIRGLALILSVARRINLQDPAGFALIPRNRYNSFRPMAREHETTAETYLVTWTVEPGEAGMRLDLFLKEKYRKLSRGYLQNHIRNGIITLNHKTTKPGQVLRVKDKVYVLSTNRGTEPEVDFGYKVLYQDDSILVIEKPGNLPVHPFRPLLLPHAAHAAPRGKRQRGGSAQRILPRAPNRPRNERRARDRQNIPRGGEPRGPIRKT